MGAAAGRAILRSVKLSKMGMTTAPHAPLLHHPLPLGLHGRHRGPGSSRSCLFSSTSAPNGSTRLPTKNLGQNKESHSELDSELSALTKAKINASFFVVVGTLIYLYGWAKSTLKESRDRKMMYLEDSITQGVRLGVQKAIENLFEAESTQSSGHGKKRDGHQNVDNVDEA